MGGRSEDVHNVRTDHRGVAQSHGCRSATIGWKKKEVGRGMEMAMKYFQQMGDIWNQIFTRDDKR